MMPTIEADYAWCPPSFRSVGSEGIWLAWWTVAVDNHSTREATRSGREQRSGAGTGRSPADERCHGASCRLGTDVR